VAAVRRRRPANSGGQADLSGLLGKKEVGSVMTGFVAFEGPPPSVLVPEGQRRRDIW